MNVGGYRTTPHPWTKELMRLDGGWGDDHAHVGMGAVERRQGRQPQASNNNNNNRRMLRTRPLFRPKPPLNGSNNEVPSQVTYLVDSKASISGALLVLGMKS